MFGRNVIKQAWVQPSSHEARNYRTPLNGPDSAFFLLGDVPVVWAWKHHRLDFETLKQGLRRTLNRVPTAAGRVRASTKGSMVISNVSSDGCLLEFQLAKRMPSEDASTAEWAAYGPGEPLIPMEPIEVPLVTATLTHFSEGGCCLFVRMSHLLTDGAGVVKFMQMWSWETAQVAVCSSPLPAQRPADLCCDHDLSSKKANAPPLEKEDLDLRLTLPQVLKFFRLAFLTKATDDVADFEFDVQAMENLKKNAQRSLGEGKWVSSYEAFMALALSCLAQAEGKSSIGTRAVVNIRGRSKLFDDNYFGVGLSVHEAEDIPTGTGCVADTAWALHESLRQGLKEMTKMEKVVLIPEHFQASSTSFLGSLLGGRELMADRARYLSVWDNCITKDLPVINSWVGYPWFELNFGLQGGPEASRPDFMRVPPEFRFRRHVHLSPKSATVYQLRMQLPKALMEKFRATFKASGFPFREVSTSAPSWFFASSSPSSVVDSTMKRPSSAASLISKPDTRDAETEKKLQAAKQIMTVQQDKRKAKAVDVPIGRSSKPQLTMSAVKSKL